MRLSELLPELQQRQITIIGTWQIRGKKGVTLGDPQKFFPHPTGPQYPIETTNNDDPDLTDAEVKAIRRRFDLSHEHTGEMM